MTAPTGDASKKAGKAMGEMEVTLSDLQDELVEAKAPPRNHFKPGWLVMAIIVALLVGGGTFYAAMELQQVSENEEVLDKTCQRRNEEIVAVNKKFDQLNFLFDVAARNRLPDQPPPAQEVQRLLEEFKKPIPLVPCESS